MNKLSIEALNQEFKNKTAEDTIKFIDEKFDTARLILASSMSIEDQVLTHMIININHNARIFFIDTGRHFNETYELMEETMRRYKFNYEVYVPKSEDLEPIITKYGPNFFYDSTELRKKCCEIRKVNPLKRVLSTVDGWICGLRREHSVQRKQIEIFEWDDSHCIYKINPISFWTEEKVWNYINKHNVPYSNLYKKNFPSIGCQPCTRPVMPGQDVRSGRWWWEDVDKKECGLHFRKDEIV